jgi:hypothetical protein
MMAVTGGMERTKAEFVALFHRAGLELVQTAKTRASYYVLEVRLKPSWSLAEFATTNFNTNLKQIELLNKLFFSFSFWACQRTFLASSEWCAPHVSKDNLRLTLLWFCLFSLSVGSIQDNANMITRCFLKMENSLTASTRLPLQTRTKTAQLVDDFQQWHSGAQLGWPVKMRQGGWDNSSVRPLLEFTRDNCFSRTHSLSLPLSHNSNNRNVTMVRGGQVWHLPKRTVFFHFTDPS